MAETSRNDTAHYPDLSVMKTGLAARCPRCGEGRLYQSMLKPVDNCAMCGLDMSFAEEGDGPAVLVILLLGVVIAGLALATSLSDQPSDLGSCGSLAAGNTVAGHLFPACHERHHDRGPVQDESP